MTRKQETRLRQLVKEMVEREATLPYTITGKPGNFYNDGEAFREHLQTLPTAMRDQVDRHVFTESELTFAAIAVCRYFEIDDDLDLVCCEVHRILVAHARDPR